MPRPISPARDYYRELTKLTTMRNVVLLDRAHPPEWKREVRARIEELIELLSRRPPEPSGTSAE